MLIWSSFLDLLRVCLFALAHVCGGSVGGGIVLLSLIVRLSLLPLTLRLALQAREYQNAIRKLEPEVNALRRRFAKDPLRLTVATRELSAENGLGPAPKGAFTGTLAQMPFGVGVYQTILGTAKRAARFLWIHDLSRPDLLVASVAAGLAGAAAAIVPSSGSSRMAGAVAAGITFVIACRLSAGVGLYWIASNVVGVIQSLLVRRAVLKEHA
jgi:YidC/Oxa1 family membrane protein insertase